jgi:D-alanyl-D-alanine carboxypeptidase
MSVKKTDYKTSSKPAAVKREAPPDAAAELVMNAENGEVIHAKNADTPRDPASLTKLMTAYVVMKAIKNSQNNSKDKKRDEKKDTLDQPIRISAGASQLNNNLFRIPVTNPDGSTEPSAFLPEGSKLTVREALTAMMTCSANGVAKALGEAFAPTRTVHKGKKTFEVAGSERDFAREMTRTAHELGMTNSSFINASGLNNGGTDQKSNLSTVRDMAILAQRMMKDFPEYEKFVSATAASANVLLPSGEKVKGSGPTTNRFPSQARSLGLVAVGPQKTGTNESVSQFTDENGNKASSGGIGLLTTSENKDGVRLVSVVMGARNPDTRYAANTRNLKASYAKLDGNPHYAARFEKPSEKTMLATVSPAKAFEAVSKKKGRRDEPVQVARNDEERPREKFKKASHRRNKERDETPVVADLLKGPSVIAGVADNRDYTRIDMGPLTATAPAQEPERATPPPPPAPTVE